MGTVDINARNDLRTIYREIEAASPEQLAMFNGPDGVWESPPVFSQAEPCAATRERLGSLADSGKVRIRLTPEMRGILFGDSVETTVAEV